MSQTEPTYRTPRWVKLLGIAAVVLLVVILVLSLIQLRFFRSDIEY